MSCEICGCDPCASESFCAAAIAAREAWNSPNWSEAAEKYHKDRPKSAPVTGRTFSETCRLADRKLAAERKAERRVEDVDILRAHRIINDPSISLERAWYELNDPRNHPTPQATVDAIMYAVRARGLAALKEPATLMRLTECDADARAEINTRIAALIASKGAA
jgi:hypothetical protein